MHLELCAVEELATVFEKTRFNVGLVFAIKSFFSSFFLCPFRDCLRAPDSAEIDDVEQTEWMVPLITCEITHLSVCVRVGLVSTYLIWILGVQVDSVK